MKMKDEGSMEAPSMDMTEPPGTERTYEDTLNEKKPTMRKNKKKIRSMQDLKDAAKSMKMTPKKPMVGY